MSALFAIALSLGLILLLAWIGLSAASAMVPDWEGWNPDVRFGDTGRMIVASVFGFGMAGISALYAGAAAWLAVVAAVAGAAGLAYVSNVFGPVEESDEAEGG